MNRISITGIGWINGMEYGCVKTNQRIPYQDSSILKKEILSKSCRNFGRIDNASKITCYSGALSMKDAGIAFSNDQKQNIGLIGTNTKGSLETDVNYFKDYLQTNRTSSRGNLFIYTLPTSPLGEAAIRLGLQGPLLYITASNNSLISVIETAAEMILFDESPVMLAGMSREKDAVYFVLKRDSERVLCNVESAIEVLRKAPAFDEMIKEFGMFRKGNGQ